MSVFSVNKSAKNQAMTFEHMAADLTERQRNEEFGRQLLSNIRQHRIAQEQLRHMTQMDEITTSSAAGAQAMLSSSFGGDVGYAYDTSERLEQIQNYQEQAQDAWGEYAESVKKAGMVGQVVGTVATVIGTIVGGPVGAAIGAAIGAGITSAMGGGHVATGSAIKAGAVGTVSAGLGAWANSAGIGASSAAAGDAGGTASSVTFTSSAGTMTASAGTTVSTAATGSAWTAGSWQAGLKVLAGSDMARGSWYYGN